MRKEALSILLAAGIACSIVGGGNKTDYQFFKLLPGDSIGRFTILSEEVKGVISSLYLIYDKDTYVIYFYDSYTKTITPYFCLDENNDPQVAVYREGLGRSQHEN